MKNGLGRERPEIQGDQLEGCGVSQAKENYAFAQDKSEKEKQVMDWLHFKTELMDLEIKPVGW